MRSSARQGEVDATCCMYGSYNRCKNIRHCHVSRHLKGSRWQCCSHPCLKIDLQKVDRLPCSTLKKQCFLVSTLRRDSLTASFPHSRHQDATHTAVREAPTHFLASSGQNLLQSLRNAIRQLRQQDKMARTALVTNTAACLKHFAESYI